MKQLKDLHKFDITLTGVITDYVDKDLKPIPEMAEIVAEDAIVAEIPRYQKAKKLGEKFAREVKN